jgi:chromosome segregation ATPase
MTEKLREQAELRYEQEQQEQRLREEAEREADKERGIRDHIERIQKQRDEERREQTRKEAEAEAEEIARERYGLEERFEAEAMTMNRTLSELQSLHGRHADALRRAGRPLGHDYRLTDLITGWWKDRFGGFNSLTGTPSPHFNAEDKPLPERDPLARRDAS